MDDRARCVARSLAMLVALLCAAARSEAAPDDVLTTEARARFEEGVARHDSGDCEGAIAKFSQAYALKKHPDVLYNLAVSHRACGHHQQAEEAFTNYLRDGKDIPPARRREAETGIVDARLRRPASREPATTSREPAATSRGPAATSRESAAGTSESAAETSESERLPTRGIALSGLVGIASDKLNFGIGVRGGVTALVPHLWLGGTFIYHVGDSVESSVVVVGTGLPAQYSASISMFYVGPEVGYEFRFDRILVRPYVGVGLGAFSYSTRGPGIEFSDTTTKFLLWPGALGTYDFGNTFFAGADLRLITIPAGPAVSLLASGGIYL